MPQMTRAWSRGLHCVKPTTEHGKRKATNSGVAKRKVNTCRVATLKVAICQRCGEKVYYTTAKPKFSKKCKLLNEKEQRQKNGYNLQRQALNMATRELEREARETPEPEAPAGFCQVCKCTRLSSGDSDICMFCAEDRVYA